VGEKISVISMGYVEFRELYTKKIFNYQLMPLPILKKFSRRIAELLTMQLYF